jgi:hypothetical protein
MAELHWRNGRTGGGTNNLDGIAYAGLLDNDAALVIDSTGVYFYYYNSASTTAEDGINIIAPDDVGASGRWLLLPVGRRSVQVVTSDYTVTLADVFIYVDATSGNIDVTLPDPASFSLPIIIVRKDSSANMVTIQGAAGTIQDEASITLDTQYEGYTFSPDGVSNYAMI